MDINNKSPMFETEDGVDEVYIREKNPVGTYLPKVMVQDRDVGEN